jgi:hypothetical protein
MLAAVNHYLHHNHGYTFLARTKCPCTVTEIQKGSKCRILDFKEEGYIQVMKSETAVGKTVELELVTGRLCGKHHICMDCGKESVGILLSTTRDSPDVTRWGQVLRPKISLRTLCKECCDEVEARAQMTEDMVVARVSAAEAAKAKAESRQRRIMWASVIRGTIRTIDLETRVL